MDSPILRAEHEEFARRMEDEHHRLSKRLETVERVAIAVEKLATNMEAMLKEQERQGDRLERLESKPAESWNTLTRSILTGIGSAIAGGIITAIVMTMTK